MPQKLDFITPTLMRVLEFFFADPMQDFHEREVMRRVGISKGSANRILRELSRLDFLTRTRRGRMVFYKLNTRNVVVRQFKILSNLYQLKELTDGLSGNSNEIILFGSCDEGTDVRGSDIDLFILTDRKSEVRKTVNRYGETLGRRISPIIASPSESVELRLKDKPLYERIMRGITLWRLE